MREISALRRRSLWPVIVLLALLAAGLGGVWLTRQPAPAPNHNALALGPGGRAGVVSVEIQPPAELDFLPVSEVLRFRRAAVGLHPELLEGEYTPAPQVFAQLVDGLPWWGLAGEYYYGPGENSIAGPAEETRFLLNPYLLVGADFYTAWQGRLEESQLDNFALDCPPQALRWWPAERRAEAVYDAICVARQQPVTFDLVAYNARDFNLGTLFVSYADSYNVTKAEIPAAPYQNPQFLHQGPSCGYPGGCNNMSPPTPDLDGLRLTGFPAQVVIWLWQQPPASLQVRPDFVFTIKIQ